MHFYCEASIWVGSYCPWCRCSVKISSWWSLQSCWCKKTVSGISHLLDEGQISSSWLLAENCSRSYPWAALVSGQFPIPPLIPAPLLSSPGISHAWPLSPSSCLLAHFWISVAQYLTSAPPNNTSFLHPPSLLLLHTRGFFRLLKARKHQKELPCYKKYTNLRIFLDEKAKC
jgi:hypothetical protein